jgi:hypothetical protein
MPDEWYLDFETLSVMLRLNPNSLQVGARCT